MIHQFGHMLGLSHSSRQTSVMTPFYLDWVNEAEVGPDFGDREAVRIREKEPHSGSQRLTSSLTLILLLVIIL